MKHFVLSFGFIALSIFFIRSASAQCVSGPVIPSIRFYPNPFADMINITNPHPFTKLIGRDIQGRTLHVKEYAGGGVSNAQIPAAGFPAGVHFVQVDGATFKLVKN